MEIIELKVMRGPNYWSEKHNNLIVVELDANGIESLEPINISSFSDRVENMIALIEKRQKKSSGIHYAGESSNIPGAILNIALIIQGLEWPQDAFTQLTKLKGKERYRLVFTYEIEKAGIFAAETAVTIVKALIEDEPYDIMYDLDEMEDIKFIYGPGPTSGYLLNEVKRLGIPFKRFGRSSLVTLGHGIRQKKIRTAVVDTTSALGLEIAGDKEETKDLLISASVPVPKGILVTDKERLKDEIKKMRFPLVTKPLNGNHGRGVTTDIRNMEQLLFGWDIAKRIGEEILIEEFIPGNDYRFLVINFKLVAIAKRTPAMVTGNGKATIQQLIDEVNVSPLRGDGPEHILAPIRVDAITKKILNQKKLTLESVLPPGETLFLKDTANISTGGTSTDVTHLVHPDNVFMAERIAKLFNLNICGIDLIATDIGIPVTRDVGAVIEVNAGPGLRMHTDPNSGGVTRNVASPIIEMLYPKPSFAIIPIIAIVGSEKEITGKYIASVAGQAGCRYGHCSANGIDLNGYRLTTEDCTDYYGNQKLLFDPMIDFAIVECNESDIWHNGLAFNKCDISVIAGDSKTDKSVPSNISAIKLAAVITQCTSETGYAVLNADEKATEELQQNLKCNIALFSKQTDNERIKKHRETGGMAAVMEKNGIAVYVGKDEVSLSAIKLEEKTNVMNVLPAVLAGFIRDFREADIVAGINEYKQL